MSWSGYTGTVPRNDDRRAALADAGITVLAEAGARGLTHRAVDASAGTPVGTASNYFPRRDDLVTALVARIAQRLEPSPDAVPRTGATTDRGLFTAYVHDVVRRLRADPHVALALFELRLEAARRPAVAAILGSWRQRAFEDDVRFNAEAGLPGGPTELALLHHAIDGLVLDHLTVPLDTGLAVEDAVDELVDRILGRPATGGDVNR